MFYTNLAFDDITVADGNDITRRNLVCDVSRQPDWYKTPLWCRFYWRPSVKGIEKAARAVFCSELGMSKVCGKSGKMGEIVGLGLILHVFLVEFLRVGGKFGF